MKKAFDHIGIPTTEPQPGESWVEFSQVWVTNPRAHPQRIEYLRAPRCRRCRPEQVGLWKLWHWPHIAYRVDDMRAPPWKARRWCMARLTRAASVTWRSSSRTGWLSKYMQYTTWVTGSAAQPAGLAARTVVTGLSEASRRTGPSAVALLILPPAAPFLGR